MALHKHNTHKGPSKKKAKKMLRDGKVKGKRLTKKQRGLFGSIAGGKGRKK